jgi:hypothetical protein
MPESVALGRNVQTEKLSRCVLDIIAGTVGWTARIV